MVGGKQILHEVGFRAFSDDDHRLTHWKVTHAGNCCGDGESDIR